MEIAFSYKEIERILFFRSMFYTVLMKAALWPLYCSWSTCQQPESPHWLVEQANSGSLQHFHTVPTLKLVQHGFLLGESLEPFSGSVLIAVSAHSQTGVMKFSADSHCSLIKEQGTGLLWPDCRQPLNVALVKWKVSDSKLRNAVPFCLIYFTP